MPRWHQAHLSTAAYLIQTDRCEGGNQGEGGGQRIGEITETEGSDAEKNDDAACCVEPAENEAIGRCGAKIA
jgi:hypothetical protein